MARLKYIGILLLCACIAVQPVTAYAAAENTEKISVDTSASRAAKKEVKKAEKKTYKRQRFKKRSEKENPEYRKAHEPAFRKAGQSQ